MCEHHQVALGFTEGRYPAGVHVCHLYSDDQEREEVLTKFLAAGIADGELNACVLDKGEVDNLRESLLAQGVNLDRETTNGRLMVAEADAFYFKGDRFDPAVMLGALRDFHAQSQAMGCPAARVIGEMSPRVQQLAGGEQLTSYESAVNELSATHPVTAICQYDTRRFSGEMILDVLAVHPMMIRNGMIIENPFYVKPEEFRQRNLPAE